MDISNLRIASSYATAWFNQAQSANILDQVYHDVILLKQVGQDNPRLIKILHSPIIPSEKKMAILQQLFGAQMHDLTLTLFAIMSKTRREGYLLPIAERFLEMYRIYHKIELASITTTCKLSAALVDYVKGLVKDWKSCQEVVLIEHIDPAIRGGFILRVGDQRLDNSIASRLAKMKKEFSLIRD
jgi:F-type H+-transporting ATPase subunit delta